MCVLYAQTHVCSLRMGESCFSPDKREFHLPKYLLMSNDKILFLTLFQTSECLFLEAKCEICFLFQVIDVKRSYVNMTATKIEVSMRKAEPLLWASLELPVSNTQQTNENSDQ